MGAEGEEILTQHLYECEACGAHGVAHYLLVKDEEGWHNVLVCKGCWEETSE